MTGTIQRVDGDSYAGRHCAGLASDAIAFDGIRATLLDAELAPDGTLRGDDGKTGFGPCVDQGAGIGAARPNALRGRQEPGQAFHSALGLDGHGCRLDMSDSKARR